MSSRASRQHEIPGPASTRCLAGLCTVRRAEPQGSSWAAVAPRASLSARWAGLALALALARGGRIPTCRSSAPNAPGPGHGSSWGSKCLGPFQVWLCTKAREKAGGLHPSAPRLLRGGSDSPRRQARQPPILPQDSCAPRATPWGGISTFQPQEPFQVSPRPSPSLPKHSRAQPCAFNDSASCSAQLILQSPVPALL